MLAVMILPVLAHGQNPPQPSPGAGPIDPGSNPNTTISGIIEAIIGWAFWLLMLLAVVFIIWAAFLYLTSGGNEEKTGKAKSYIVAAVVAIVIALLARVIVAVVQSLVQAH